MRWSIRAGLSLPDFPCPIAPKSEMTAWRKCERAARGSRDCSRLGKEQAVTTRRGGPSAARSLPQVGLATKQLPASAPWCPHIPQARGFVLWELSHLSRGKPHEFGVKLPFSDLQKPRGVKARGARCWFQAPGALLSTGASCFGSVMPLGVYNNLP